LSRRHSLCRRSPRAPDLSGFLRCGHWHRYSRRCGRGPVVEPIWKLHPGLGHHALSNRDKVGCLLMGYRWRRLAVGELIASPVRIESFIAFRLWDVQFVQGNLQQVLPMPGPLIWSPLSIALAHRSWCVMVESMQGCDESIASTMDQTHIRGLVTNIPSIRRGPALLFGRGSARALPPRGLKGCPSGSHRISASIHDVFPGQLVRDSC
jgi:hypothetical protein